jgi:hypothetical protein
MDRVVMLGLVAAWSCVFASQAVGQLPPLGPATPADLPGASIHSVPLPGARVPSPMPPPANPGGLPLASHPLPGMPSPAPGFAGPNSFGGAGSLPGRPFGDPAAAASPQAGTAGAGATYLSPMPPPKAPQNLGLYRPSFPEGIEAKKLSPLPSVAVREYPYLRRGGATDRFITPPGMEMPEEVGPTSSPLTWTDRLRNLVDPLGVLPLP